MKQIIPFKKELLFQTKVSEITSISLEHTLSLKNDDFISGEFHINGDYKMTEGSINREKFAFRLPFEIAMDSRYDAASMVIDIDNFYYEIINNESLQVNIDVYIEGEKLEESIPSKEEVLEPKLTLETPVEDSSQEANFPDLSDFITTEESKEEDLERTVEMNDLKEEPSVEVPSKEELLETKCSNFSTEIPSFQSEPIERNIEYPQVKNINFEDGKEGMVAIQKNTSSETTTTEKKTDFHLFENMDSSDTYVTYHVYIVKETDTIDSILTKYEVSKEALSLYNNIEDLKPGMKLIIPN